MCCVRIGSSNLVQVCSDFTVSHCPQEEIAHTHPPTRVSEPGTTPLQQSLSPNIYIQLTRMHANPTVTATLCAIERRMFLRPAVVLVCISAHFATARWAPATDGGTETKMADPAFYIFNNNSYCGADRWTCVNNPAGEQVH